MRHARPAVPLRGFSMIELMVVITILALLIGFGVPAISNILRDSEQSLAENQLRNGLLACRDAAIRADKADAAAVFFFRPDGRIVIVACQYAGKIEDSLNDRGVISGTQTEVRDVFVPLADIAPITLPRNWSVRAYAAPELVRGDDPTKPADGWYENLKPLAGRGLWVFPETDFVNRADPALGGKGWQRQTFMVRFKGTTGQIATSDGRKVIVLDTLNTTAFRGTAPYSNAAARFDLASDPALLARRLTTKDLTGTGLSLTDLRKVIGDASPDTVLAASVTELALYQEANLLGALGASRTNAATGKTLYADPAQTGYMGPVLDPTLLTPSGMTADGAALNIGEWLTGGYKPAGATQPVRSGARLYTIDRNLGLLQEM